MKILFVSNSVYVKGNGLSTSARTTIFNLRKAGVEVRVLSMRNQEQDGEQPDYPLEPFIFPLFQPLILKQGFAFACSDDDMIEEAVSWADVVHLEEAFVLEWKVIKSAGKKGIPCVATYHLHPENILSTLFLGHAGWANRLLLKVAQRVVYDRISAIQCPSESVMRRLQGMGFKADLHLISNGISLDGEHGPSVPQTSPFLISCIGRLSNEKDQYTLMRAVRHCRHREEIQLYFAGKGPCERKMKRMAHRLFSDGVVKYEPVFAFHSAEELKELARKSYLVVHCAEFEVEGLSLPEALLEGAVPVIAKGELTATSQFALDERSVFPVGDDRSLAALIDWWIEHPDARAEMSPVYAGSLEEYNIDKSIASLVNMYESVLKR